MTGIAAILGDENSDVSSKLDLMLAAMRPRGTTTAKLVVKGQFGAAAIGSCTHSDQKQPGPKAEETSLVLDGPFPEGLDVDVIGGQSDEQSISEAIDSRGSFSCLSINGGRILAARDVLGRKPLYVGRKSDGTIGFASTKTALTSLQMLELAPVPPGRLVSASGAGISVVTDKSLARQEETPVSEEEASEKLRELLVDSFDDDLPQDLALAFSGGIDSTLVAQAAKEDDLHPELITIGIKGQPEIRHARATARQLGLDITVKEISQSDVLASLPRVVSTVESVDPVLVGVSVPLFFACEVAEEIGSDQILAGQLSDELFAGYGRFDDFARKNDFRGARDEIWNSVLAASNNDFEPGDKLAVSHHLELRCPFAFLPLVKYALRLPVHLKLKVVGGRVVRKYILRRLARDWKLPEDVVNRPKKAVQYSTGVQKALLKEAKRRGLTLTGLLESLR